MDSNYIRLFIGSSVAAERIVDNLKEIGIVAILKNEAESARLAGFGNVMQDNVEVYVHNNEFEQASSIL